MTDAEINEAVARALGYTVGNAGTPDALDSMWIKLSDGTLVANAQHVAVRAAWAQSLDACFRDLVPEARGRGWCWSMALHPEGGDSVRFALWRPAHAQFVDSVDADDPSPSRALCLAWLKTKAQPA